MKGLVLGLVFVACSWLGPVLADPFSKLAVNRWVWNPQDAETCDGGKHCSVSDDRTSIWVETGKPMKVRGTTIERAQYTVLAHGPNYIDMFLHLEKWKDDSGQLVRWRLVFLDNGQFVWIRSDWDNGRSTRPMTPCRLLG